MIVCGKNLGLVGKGGANPLSQSLAALPALPKGELLDGVRNLTAPKKLSPWERWHCEAMTERARPSARRKAFSMKETTVVKNYKMLPTARRLRREMTPQEKTL